MIVAMQVHDWTVRYLAPRLREEDRREMRTVSPHLCTVESLQLAVSESVESRVIVSDQHGSFAVLGVQPSVFPGWGSVWLVATPDVSHHAVAFLRECKRWRDRWAEMYPAGIHALADERNELHLRWLEILDFHVEPHAWCFGGNPFALATYTTGAD